MTSTNNEWPCWPLALLILVLLSLCLSFAGTPRARAAVVLPEPEPVVCEEPVAPEEPEIPEPDMALVEQLAVAIYREAGGDAVCDACRYRVGDVVLNRVADPRFPDTIEQVLTQQGQYGTMHWDGVTWPTRAHNQGEQHAVVRARETAYDLLTGNHSDLAGEGYIFQSEFPDLGHSATTCCGIYYAKG